MNLPGYVQAEEAFVHMTLDQRLKLQRLLAAAGYWPAVPDADFSARLFDAILRFQVDNGFAAHLPPSKTTPSVEGRQDTGAGFDQNDAGLSRVDTSEVARQRRARQLRDRAGEFDPLRAGAWPLHSRNGVAPGDTDERVPRQGDGPFEPAFVSQSELLLPPRASTTEMRTVAGGRLGQYDPSCVLPRASPITPMTR